ncbi:MAG TPA: hypothetical protein VGB77_05625, partial [Abditibacteriaceae bacterium]
MHLAIEKRLKQAAKWLLVWVGKLPNRAVKFLLFAGLVLLLAMRFATPLITPVAPLGIVSLQLANKLGSARSILQSWTSSMDGNLLCYARWNILIDCLFILCYVTLLCRGCLWSSQFKKLARFRNTGKILAVAQLLTLVLDYAENYFLWQELKVWEQSGYNPSLVFPEVFNLNGIWDNGQGYTWPFGWTYLVCILAVLKFSLIFAALFYIARGFLFSPYYRRFLCQAELTGQIFRLTWPSLLLPLITTWFLLAGGQPAETLRVLAQDISAKPPEVWFNWLRIFCLVGSSFYLAGVAWLCARSQLALKPIFSSCAIAKLWIMLCAVLPLGIMVIALWIAKGPLKDDLGNEYPQAPSVVTGINCILTGYIGLILLTYLSIWFKRQTLSQIQMLDMKQHEAENIKAKNGEAADRQVGGSEANLPSEAEVGETQPVDAQPVDAQPAAQPNEPKQSFKDFTPGWKRSLKLLGLGPFVLLLLCMVITDSQGAIYFGAPAMLIMAFATMIPLLTLFIYWREQTSIPVITILVIIAIVFKGLNLHDNHGIRHSAAPKVQMTKAPIGDEFERWLRGRPEIKKNPQFYKKQPYAVFLVAAPGGATLSGYQTAMALAQLEDRFPGFRHHVFAISGVSGGSVGAATYAGLCDYADRNFANKPVPPNWWCKKTDEILKRDLMAPVIGTWFYGETAQQFIPFPVSLNLPSFDENTWDRALPLEKGLEASWDDALGASDNPFCKELRDLGKDFQNRGIPALFLNTTNVETGQRLALNSIPASEKEFTSRALRTLSDEHPYVSMRLSTAAILSARFPFISPAGSIPDYTEPKPDSSYPQGNYKAIAQVSQKRYVDAGYYDNSGGATLFNILEAIKNRRDCLEPGLRKPDCPKTKSPLPRFRVYVLNAYLSDYEFGAPAQQSKKPPAGFEETGSIISALISTWGARMNASMHPLNLLLKTLDETESEDKKKSDDNKSVKVAPSGIINLKYKTENSHMVVGWLLSQESRRNMQRQACWLIRKSGIGDNLANKEPSKPISLTGNVL